MVGSNINNICEFCGETKDEGRWLVIREASRYGSRTTFTSNKEIGSVREQKKLFRCKDCLEEKKMKKRTLDKNLKVLSEKPIEPIFDKTQKNEQDIKKLSDQLSDAASEVYSSYFKNELPQTNESKKTEEHNFETPSLEKGKEKQQLVAWTKKKVWEDSEKFAEEKLKKSKSEYLSKDYCWTHRLTKKEKQKIKEAKSKPQLDQIVDDIKENHKKIKELVEDNIFQ